MIKYIITDFDGVIRHWNNWKLEEYEQKQNLEKNSLISICFNKYHLEQAITGSITDELWRIQIKEELDKQSLDSDLIVKYWKESDFYIDHKIFELINTFSKNIKIVLASNATSCLNDDLLHSKIYNQFEYIFNSSEIGIVKPNLLYFEHILKTLKCSKNEVVFIDDSITNVKAGTQFGIKSHHFKGQEKLILFLSEIIQ